MLCIHGILAMALCPCLSVCLCLCLSQVGLLLKRLNAESHKQHLTIAKGTSFLMPKISAKFVQDHDLRGRKCRWGVSKSATFDKYLAISRKLYKIDAWFLLKSNRKSYALYRIVTLPVTLSAPNHPKAPHFLHFAPPFIAS